MAQIASVLAVAIVFIIYYLHFIVREGGAYMRGGA